MRDTLAILGIGFLFEMLYRSLMYSGWTYYNSVTTAVLLFVLCGCLFGASRANWFNG